jgi:hypothetical protein
MKSKLLQETTMAKILGFICVMFSLAMMVPNALAQLNSNVPINDHVVLVGDQGGGFCLSGDLPFNREMLPTGQIVPFTIPANRTLVITDVNWRWNDNQNRFPNVHQLLKIYLIAGASTSGNVVALAGAQLDGTSFGSASISMPSGFPAASGTTVCGNFRTGFTGSPAVFIDTVIRGYLQ